MPIEIKELHIRVAVNTTGTTQSLEPANSTIRHKAPSALAQDRDVLIAECVEQVLNILKNKKER